MADDKNFLQTIKLEISRTFKLDPYERTAFHNLLGVIKSDQGRDLLIKELTRDSATRMSAVYNLARFNDKSLIPLFTEILSGKPGEEEIAVILDFFRLSGAPLGGDVFIDLIEKLRAEKGNLYFVFKAFEVMSRVSSDNEDVLNYIMSVIESGDSKIMSAAVLSLADFRRIDIYEDLIRRNDDSLTRMVFDSIYKLNVEIMDKNDSDEEKDYSTEDRFAEKALTADEEILLQIKVLLGKVAPKYDSCSAETKVSLINAMLSCNHRESLLYAVKGLEGKDSSVKTQTLYSIYNNITRLRTPEKLLRNLLSMSVLNDRENILITEIFYKYFSEKSRTRSDILFRDKQYGYISASLESFFETYRREFMIPDVVENSFPENFQKIRSFILRKFNPEIKRKLTDALSSHNIEHPKKIMDYISGWIKDIGEDEMEPLNLLIDLLLDQDIVSREKSAARLDSINFDKVYLQKRIIRLCMIISSLKIESAAKSLVYIYNYLKKYPEPEILDSAIHALCRLNYSYMLSEVEIMVTAGSPEDQVKAVTLLPLFTEKRLINIIIEYLKNNITSDSETVKKMTEILSEQNIKSNINVISVFKEIIENNPDIDIKRKAINGLGNCAIAEDIEYLNKHFHETNDNGIKEAAVKAIVSIIAEKGDYNKQQLLRFSQEYLKDSNIRVRIFSCMILIRLGNQDALRVIRDMLSIKNKSIQREIFTILSDVKSSDFNFFLISLLRAEYGISRDIISVLKKLPPDELKEIEIFIINLFRKFEIPSQGTSQVKTGSIQEIDKQKVTILYVIINNYKKLAESLNFYDLIKLNLKIDNLIIPSVSQHNGIVSHKSSSALTVWFHEPENAVKAGSMIREKIIEYNESTVYNLNLDSSLIISGETVSIYKDEIIDFIEEKKRIKAGIPVSSMVIFNETAAHDISEAYYSEPLPEILFSGSSGVNSHFILISPVNFLSRSYSIIDGKEDAIEKKKEMDIQIASQVKSLNMQGRSTTSVAIAGELENVGLKLKGEFEEIEKYVNRRSTDRELSKNVRQMLNNAYNLYRVETSKLTIK